MKSEAIANRYTDALLNLTLACKAAEAVLKQIKWCQTVGASIFPVLANPLVPVLKKEALLTQFFMKDQDKDSQKAGKILFHLICLLIRKGRIGYLDDIFKLYPKRYTERSGIRKGTLTLAYPLTDDCLSRLRSKLSDQFQKKIDFDIVNDPDILGGFVFTTDSEQVDASLKSRLHQLARCFKTAPVGG